MQRDAIIHTLGTKWFGGDEVWLSESEKWNVGDLLEDYEETVVELETRLEELTKLLAASNKKPT